MIHSGRLHDATLTGVVGLCVAMLGCGTASEPAHDARSERALGTPPPAVTAAPAPAVTSAVATGGAGPREPAAGVLEPVSTDSETPARRLERYRAAWATPRYRPALLDEAARPARLAPGAYACKVSREYRLRACRVERDAEGRTFLEFGEGNLLALRGVVYDHAGALEFEGWLSDAEPFGCTSCDERCILDPASCSCTPLPVEAVSQCVAQPARFTLRAAATPGTYRGVLVHHVYYNEYMGEGDARHAEGFTAQPEKLEITLVRGAPKQ